MEFDMMNIFLEKSHIKWGEETIPRLFTKKSKLSILQEQFYKKNSLGFGKTFKNKLRTKSGLLSSRT